jgi:hypothetical protein
MSPRAAAEESFPTAPIEVRNLSSGVAPCHEFGKASRSSLIFAPEIIPFDHATTRSTSPAPP